MTPIMAENAHEPGIEILKLYKPILRLVALWVTMFWRLAPLLYRYNRLTAVCQKHSWLPKAGQRLFWEFSTSPNDGKRQKYAYKYGYFMYRVLKTRELRPHRATIAKIQKE